MSTSQIEMKLTYKVEYRIQNQFNSYLNFVAQNLAYLCLSAKEVGIPFPTAEYTSVADFINKNKGKATGDLKMILQLSESVEDFFIQSTHDWLIAEMKVVLEEIVEVNPFELSAWMRDEIEPLDGPIQKIFKENPLYIVFQILEHTRVSSFFYEVLTKQLLQQILPMNFMFMFKKGVREYDKTHA